MASRMLARLGAGVAISAARGHHLPAGQLGGPSLAGAMDGPSIISRAIQIRFGSGGAMSNSRLTRGDKKMEELTARVQALEKAGAMSMKLVAMAEKRAELAEKRADAAERRAEAAERRAEVMEGRMERVEHIVFMAQTRMDNQFAYMLRLHEDMERNLKLNMAASAHTYWKFSKEIDKHRTQMFAMKAAYMNGVLSAKAAVSVSSWRIVMLLMSAFGAITAYYMPYVVSDVKTEILKEAGKMIKEALQPVIDQVTEVKQQQAKKGRWF